MPSVSTTSPYDAREHYRAIRATSRETPIRFIPPVMLLFVVAMLVTIVAGSWSREAWTDTARSALPWVLLVLFWSFLLPASQRWQAYAAGKRDPSKQGPQERSVDENGFHARSNGLNTDIGWQMFRRAVETEEFFLFFMSWQCAHYLPKRGLSEEQLGIVRKHTRAALGDRARLMEPD